MKTILNIIGLIVGVAIAAQGFAADELAITCLGTLIIGFCLPSPKR